MGDMHPLLVSRLLKWAREFPQGQVHFYFTFKVTPVDRARNQIVEFFLNQRLGEKQEAFTHLLMIDADTVPPDNAVSKLLSHDKDIISALTPILRYNDENKSWEVYDNCFIAADRDENGKIIQTHIAQRDTGLQQIFRCGTACILIKREVFDRLSHPYFRFITNEEGTKHTRSEDINFCDMARNRGFDIWADTSVYCGHHKDLMI